MKCDKTVDGEFGEQGSEQLLDNLKRMNVAYKYGVKCIMGSDIPIDFDSC